MVVPVIREERKPIPCVHGDSFPCRQCLAARHWYERTSGIRLTYWEFLRKYTAKKESK